MNIHFMKMYSYRENDDFLNYMHNLYYVLMYLFKRYRELCQRL